MTRCPDRVLFSDRKRPVWCEREEGHPADFLFADDSDRAHYNSRAHAWWTDSSPDRVGVA